ncbi:hypothetical protein JW835_15500 [bacterium]|nr:hypothetical protein [bacterium]
MSKNSILFTMLIIMPVFGQNRAFEQKTGSVYHVHPGLAKPQFDSTDVFDVLHYRLDLNFPFQSSAFSGSVTLTCRALKTLEGIDLEMGDLTADRIHLRSESVAFEHRSETLSLVFPRTISADDTFSIRIHYHGEPDEQGFYFYDRCAYTMSEPEEARYWFPCHDVPWDKATAELFITVPAGVEAASIGLIQSRTVSVDGLFETFHWLTEYPVATYLICVTMSDEYSVWSHWFVTETGDSLEMPYYVFAEDSAKSKIDVKNMKTAMAFFTGTFGSYPFEKYGTATVSKAWFGGMEHQTMTTVIQNWFRGDGSMESGFVHELAHMWWGDAVTLSDWPEIWLNEGFATYSQMLFTEYFYGEAVFRSHMQNNRRAYFEQTSEFDFPIYDPPRESLFNWAITYIKGAWVLHMLRGVVGEDPFFKILSEYYTQYKYRNASIHEFRKVCESVYGKSLDWFFEEWIYRTGYMQLAYGWKNDRLDNGGYRIRMMIEQGHDLFHMPIHMQIQGPEGGVDTTLWISSYSHRFTFMLPDSATGIQIDPEGWVLMTDTLVQNMVPEYVLSKPKLLPVSPNPCEGQAMIQYILPWNRADWSVEIAIFNLRGQKIRTLINQNQIPETYSVFWDGRNTSGRRVASGMYILELRADNYCMQQKITVIR